MKNSGNELKGGTHRGIFLTMVVFIMVKLQLAYSYNLEKSLFTLFRFMSIFSEMGRHYPTNGGYASACDLCVHLHSM